MQLHKLRSLRRSFLHFHLNFNSFLKDLLILVLRPVLRNRQVCLLVDSEEPLRERFVRVAQQRGLSARTRKLPVGDFLWVLLPPGVNPDTVRDMPEQELVRKTWWLFTIYKIFWKIGSSQNILRSTGTSKKEVLSFWMEYSKQKFVFHSFKAIFDASFRPLRSFFGRRN